MATIAEKKAAEQKWTPAWAFNVVLKDGVPRYWAEQAFTFNGHDYEAVVLDFSPMTIEGGGVYGVDTVVELRMTLNNADCSLNALTDPSNWRGGVIQPFFFFRDPSTGETTTDWIAYPKFLIDLPERTWPRLEFTAHNKWNLARKELPASRITRKDRYPFPSTAAERQAAYDDPTSEFYAIGYSPEHGHGNWKVPPDTPYTAADYDGTREKLEEIGLSVRYGGFGKLPPTTSFTPKKGEHALFRGSANEAKYGQVVPLVFGTCRIQPIVLDSWGPPAWNGARLSHCLLSDGVNFAPDEGHMGIEDVLDVWLLDGKDGRPYRVPRTSDQPHITGAWTFYSGYYGSQKGTRINEKYRNIDPEADYGADDPKDRDLYSGLAYLEIGIPKELAQGAEGGAGPRMEAIVKGLKVETWDANGDSTWQWSDNPVWIFIHLLKLLRWKTEDIDKTAAYEAAAYCDEVLPNGRKRFRCNLALTSATKAADVLRGIRNCCRMMVGYSPQGKLAIRIKRTTAEEGGPAFALDATTIARDDSGELQVRKFHKSAFETANVFSCNFQNEDNLYNADSLTKYDIGNINQTDERISADSITAILGIPSFDQAERILNWLKYENVDLNEYYQVRATLALIEAKVGQIGTITEPRLGLSGQLCRIVGIAPGPGTTIELVLQRHADAGYTDDATISPALRAAGDSTYSPRSVGGKTGASGAPALTELFVQDDLNADLYRRKIKVDFTPPPTAYETGFSSRTVIYAPEVQTTGGAIEGGQTLFVEVCPRKGGVDGLPSDYLTISIPAGTSTNRLSFTCRLPAEADQYTVRVGKFPGKLFKQARASSPGTDPFTITVSDIGNLDSTDLSPDPRYDHARVFYCYSGSPQTIRDGGATQSAGQDSLTFEPELPESGDSTITVIVCSANADESDFYPLAIAPQASLNLTKDTGNPAGASDLEILTNADDAAVPAGCVVFEFNRETSNYRSIAGVAAVLSAELPAEGPYKAERDAHPSCVIETGSCQVVAGSRQIAVTRSANPDVVGRVLLIYTDDASPDSDLEGEIVAAEGENSLSVNTPFHKTGTFAYAIVKRWWDIGGGDTANKFYQWFPIDQLGDVEQAAWRTPPVPAPAGTWYASLYARNLFGVGTRLTAGPKTVAGAGAPPSVPDGLEAAALASGLAILFAVEARKWNEGITEAEFRAKFFAAGTNYESVDLRTPAEGGTLEHNGTTAFVVAGIVATQYGAQYQITSAAQGVWYYAWRLKNAEGWSVWSDGNDTPRYARDRAATEDPSMAADGPPADWTVAIQPAAVGHAVVVTVSRPATRGKKILAWAVQIKDATMGAWRALDAGAGAAVTKFDGTAVGFNASNDNRRFTRVSGQGLGTAAVGDLVLLDYAGGSWALDNCNWATIEAIEGNDPATATWFEIAGRFNNAAQTDLRLKIVKPPWEWNTEGYLGDQPNRGLWSKTFWAGGGDVSTQTFVSDPIAVPAGTDLSHIQARVWFDNGFSRSDGGVHSDFCPAGGGGSGSAIQLDASSGYVYTDAALGYVFTFTMTTDTMLMNPTNARDGQPIVWIVRQDAVGGHALSLDGKFRLGDQVEVVVSDMAGSRTLVGCVYSAAADQFDMVPSLKGY